MNSIDPWGILMFTQHKYAFPGGNKVIIGDVTEYSVKSGNVSERSQLRLTPLLYRSTK